MIDRANNRLNLIFVLWFLVVALVPSLVLGLFANSLQKSEGVAAAEHDLAMVARLKADRLQGYAKDTIEWLRGVAKDRSGTALRDFIDAEQAQKTSSLYLTEADGAITYPTEAAHVNLTWMATTLNREPQARLINHELVLAYPIPDSSEWLVRIRNSDSINTLLSQDINDRRNLDVDQPSSVNDDLGATGDLILLNEQGFPLSDSLMQGDLDETQPIHNALSNWIANGEENDLAVRTTLFGRDVLLHARRAEIIGQRIVVVTTLDYAEVLGLFYEHHRGLLLVFILAMVGVLLILYIFVIHVGRFLVRPLQSTIADIIKSSRKIQESIGTTEEMIGTQETVAAVLAGNYKNELRDINAVDGGLRKIVESLGGISEQTTATAKSVQLIDALALKSQKEAAVAHDSISSIKRLATAHDVLFATLQHYSSQVDAIAVDVQRLAQATKYLSLNATIEVNKADGSTHSLSSLVSEVGRLALLSHDASVRITELVTSIQTQLARSKDAASHERQEADNSLVIIDQALQSLNKMSRDTMKISASVRVIDQQVTKESASTQAIAKHSQDLTQQAKATLRQATRINALVGEQKQGVKANMSAFNKLMAIITKLNHLIGARGGRS